MGSLKHQILGVKPRMEKVSEPDLGVDVYVRRMNGLQRDAYLSALYAASDDKDMGRGFCCP